MKIRGKGLRDWGLIICIKVQDMMHTVDELLDIRKKKQKPIDFIK